MLVYTPPGYEAGTEKYPVFYLLHGAGDSDDSWTSVGRANFILDNLIAANKARPMIIVMPAGHTGPFSFIIPTAARMDPRLGNPRFEDDFLKDLLPFIEKNYPCGQTAPLGDRRAVHGRCPDPQHHRPRARTSSVLSGCSAPGCSAPGGFGKMADWETSIRMPERRDGQGRAEAALVRHWVAGLPLEPVEGDRRTVQEERIQPGLQAVHRGHRTDGIT